VEWLLADPAQPVLGAAVGTLAGVLIVGALLLRSRIARYRGTVPRSSWRMPAASCACWA
jgi:hypothetical protein